MADSHDKHNEAVVYHLIDNSIVPYANPQKTFSTLQFLRALRARILTK